MLDLCGKACRAKSSGPLPLPPRIPVVLAEYNNDQGNTDALVILDLSVASSAGAALSLFPKNVVADCVRSGQLTESIAENVREIFNVITGLLNSRSEAPHVTLGNVCLPPAKVAPEVWKKWLPPSGRLDLDVSLEGYESGKMAIIQVAVPKS
jgi:hypothetical protein